MQSNNTKSAKQRTVERRAFGIVEVAASLEVSAGFIRLEIARGRLQVLRLGRRLLITRPSFDAYMAAGVTQQHGE